MNYLETKCLSYTIGLSEISEYSSFEILNMLSHVFLLKDEKKEMIKNIVCNDIFQTLFSSKAVEQYQNYIISFCKDKEAFGKKNVEFEALEIKKSILRFVESIANGTYVKSEIQTIFAQNRTNEDLVSFSYGLLLYLSETKSKNLYMDIFKKLSNKGFADASLILLYLTNDKKTNQNLLHNLSLTLEMSLNNETLKEIYLYYGCVYEELEEEKDKKRFFWD